MCLTVPCRACTSECKSNLLTAVWCCKLPTHSYMSVRRQSSCPTKRESPHDARSRTAAASRSRSRSGVIVACINWPSLLPLIGHRRRRHRTRNKRVTLSNAAPRCSRRGRTDNHTVDSDSYMYSSLDGRVCVCESVCCY